MSLKKWILQLVGIIHSVKDENLHWQGTNHELKNKLKHQQALYEQSLVADLQKRNAQLAHDLELLKTQHETDLVIFKTRCEQDIKDYKHYLKALDQLKLSIQNSYAHLPEAVAFTIHHHAKQLLNKMWEVNDFEKKMQLEMKLIQFMTVLHEETSHYLEQDNDKKLPEKTLNLIQQKENSHNM